jgi:hypothetical protein
MYLGLLHSSLLTIIICLSGSSTPYLEMLFTLVNPFLFGTCFASIVRSYNCHKILEVVMLP